MEVSSVIGEIYDASSGTDDWSAVGRRLFSFLGVNGGSLRVTRRDGSSINVFEPDAPEESLYAERYSHIDPIRAAAKRIVPGADWASAVRVSDDIVPEDMFHRSEFYQDFAKPNGQEHILLGAVGDREHTVLGFFRDKLPFCEEKKRDLARLMPHVQRALQLRRRLREADVNARFGHCAFESLPGGAIVVDADLNVLFANATAQRIVGGADAPIALSRCACPSGAGQLVIRNRKKATELRRLVADAAGGGSGGALRLEVEHDDDDRIDQLAVLVSPQPAQFACDDNEAGMSAPVLILINELSRPCAPRNSLLRDLFGLSLAEGAVAMALLGGQTAESVARERDVSLETIRSQIRTLLRKSDASNLRDFERMGAVLATMVH